MKIHYYSIGGIKIKMYVENGVAKISIGTKIKLIQSLELTVTNWDQVMTDPSVDLPTSIIHFKGKERHPHDMHAQSSWFNDSGDGLIYARQPNLGPIDVLVPIAGFNHNPVVW